MQYKIPIQIENEDSIIFGLSLRQLGIIIVGALIAYGTFQKFEGEIANMPLIIICILIALVFLVIAKFKHHEMTFFPFILNFIRLKVNGDRRQWARGVDSFSVLRTGYLKISQKKAVMDEAREKTDDSELFEASIGKL